MSAIGRMRQVIQIQAPSPTRDAGGGISSEGWATIADGTRPAEILPMSGTKQYQSQQLQELITHKINIRYLAAVTDQCRVVYGSRIFQITSVIDWQERHRWMSLMCLERRAV